MILRSAPAVMPSMPISQPLMTSPTPSLKVKGGPFLLTMDKLVLPLKHGMVVFSYNQTACHQLVCQYNAY